MSSKEFSKLNSHKMNDEEDYTLCSSSTLEEGEIKRQKINQEEIKETEILNVNIFKDAFIEKIHNLKQKNHNFDYKLFLNLSYSNHLYFNGVYIGKHTAFSVNDIFIPPSCGDKKKYIDKHAFKKGSLNALKHFIKSYYSIYVQDYFDFKQNQIEPEKQLEIINENETHTKIYDTNDPHNNIIIMDSVIEINMKENDEITNKNLAITPKETVTLEKEPNSMKFLTSDLNQDSKEANLNILELSNKFKDKCNLKTPESNLYDDSILTLYKQNLLTANNAELFRNDSKEIKKPGSFAGVESIRVPNDINFFENNNKETKKLESFAEVDSKRVPNDISLFENHNKGTKKLKSFAEVDSKRVPNDISLFENHNKETKKLESIAGVISAIVPKDICLSGDGNHEVQDTQSIRENSTTKLLVSLYGDSSYEVKRSKQTCEITSAIITSNTKCTANKINPLTKDEDFKGFDKENKEYNHLKIVVANEKIINEKTECDQHKLLILDEEIKEQEMETFFCEKKTSPFFKKKVKTSLFSRIHKYKNMVDKKLNELERNTDEIQYIYYDESHLEQIADDDNTNIFFEVKRDHMNNKILYIENVIYSKYDIQNSSNIFTNSTIDVMDNYEFKATLNKNYVFMSFCSNIFMNNNIKLKLSRGVDKGSNCDSLIQKDSVRYFQRIENKPLEIKNLDLMLSKDIGMYVMQNKIIFDMKKEFFKKNIKFQGFVESI